MTSFVPPRLLRNRHIQSMLTSIPPRSVLLRMRARRLQRGAETWLLDCGDGVRLLGYFDAALPASSLATVQPGRAARLAVLLHGWEGSARSTYVLSLALLLRQYGYDVLRLNLRDHGASHHLNPGIFHSCLLGDVTGALADIARRRPYAQLFLAGFSLGGNFLLRAGCEPQSPAGIARIVAISPVLEPAACMEQLESGPFIYRRHFLERWSRSLRLKQEAWPDLHQFDDMRRLNSLSQRTAGLVERCTDFANVDEYLSGYAITGTRLERLRFPATILAAEDDPIVPVADLARLAQSERLSVRRLPLGGHCGFVTSLSGPSWADRTVLAEFEQNQAQERPGN